MAAQEQSHAEHREGRHQQVRLQEGRLERVAGARARIRPGHPVLEDSVEESRHGHGDERGMVPPGLPALHRGTLRVGETAGVGAGGGWRMRWRASTRRAASVVARTVRVAPVTGWMPRLIDRSSFKALPANCSYQRARGRYSSGSRKERTSIRAIAPAGIDDDHDRLRHRPHEVGVEVGRSHLDPVLGRNVEVDQRRRRILVARKLLSRLLLRNRQEGRPVRDGRAGKRELQGLLLRQEDLGGKRRGGEQAIVATAARRADESREWSSSCLQHLGSSSD